jgi:hypothetical protein
VFLVRGEVLRRHPNTIVYAVKARLGSDGRRELGDEERHPVFRGTLSPDVSFFGFELTAAQVRGTTDRSGDQGWWLMIQEQPAEPRFGLAVGGAFGAPVTSWPGMTWNSLAQNDAALRALTHIDLDAHLPNTSGVTDANGVTAWHADSGAGARGSRASDLAYITLVRPVRVAWHGSDMIPEPRR